MFAIVASTPVAQPLLRGWSIETPPIIRPIDYAEKRTTTALPAGKSNQTRLLAERVEQISHGSARGKSVVTHDAPAALGLVHPLLEFPQDLFEGNMKEEDREERTCTIKKKITYRRPQRKDAVEPNVQLPLQSRTRNSQGVAMNFRPTTRGK